MALASQSMDQMYSLRGLNLITPDQLVDDSSKTAGQSPHAPNSRLMQPQADTDPRTAVESRGGAGFYTVPVGEALDQVKDYSTSILTRQITDTSWYMSPFTPSVSKVMTALDIKLKKNIAYLVPGHCVVQIVTLAADGYTPTATLATSSVKSSLLTSNFAYYKARFIAAPALTAGTKYGVVIRSDSASGFDIALNSLAQIAGNTPDAGATWGYEPTTAHFKTYMADAGTVKGQFRFTNKNGIKQTLFAHGTSIYKVDNESTGAVSAIKTGLNPLAKRVRFINAYEQVFIVNGYDPMMKWNGTTLTLSVHTADFMIPDNVVIFHDRAWYTNRDNPTRLYFSGIYPDLEVVDVVNFQYVPDTASVDPITGFTVFQNQLTVFTKESKYLITGDDAGSLGLSQSPGGTKGAVSQEAISNAERVVYFVSQDGGAYYYDGAQDFSLSDPVQPIFSNMSNIDEIDTSVSDKQWRIYYKTSGDLSHRHMLLLDIRFNEWLEDTDTYTRLPVTWSQEDNKLVEASSVYGALFFAEVDDSHLGDFIRWQYWTNYKKYTSGIAKDRVRTFRAIFATPDRTVDVKVGKDADFANNAVYKTITLLTDGIQYDDGHLYGDLDAYYGLGARVSQPRVSLSGRASNTQYRFEKDVLYTKIQLYGYEAIIKSSRPR